jgi:hypothetical protein
MIFNFQTWDKPNVRRWTPEAVKQSILLEPELQEDTPPLPLLFAQRLIRVMGSLIKMKLHFCCWTTLFLLIPTIVTHNLAYFSHGRQLWGIRCLMGKSPDWYGEKSDVTKAFDSISRVQPSWRGKSWFIYGSKHPSITAVMHIKRKQLRNFKLRGLSTSTLKRSAVTSAICYHSPYKYNALDHHLQMTYWLLVLLRNSEGLK